MIKRFLAWVYNWVTVLTGLIVGALSVLPDLLNGLLGVDFSPLVGPTRAAQIVAVVAILKAVLAFWQHRRAVK
jgi:hypothetical protein